MRSVSSNREDGHDAMPSSGVSLMVPRPQQGGVWSELIVAVLHITIEYQHLSLLDIFARLSEGQHPCNPVDSANFLMMWNWRRYESLMRPSLNVKEDDVVARLFNFEVSATNTVRGVLL